MKNLFPEINQISFIKLKIFLDKQTIETVKAKTILSVENTIPKFVYLVLKGSLDFRKHVRKQPKIIES